MIRSVSVKSVNKSWQTYVNVLYGKLIWNDIQSIHRCFMELHMCTKQVIVVYVSLSVC